MTRYLLDTNVVSELRRGRPHGAVVAWMGSLKDDQIFVSAVTTGELQAGVERTRSQDPQKADEIEAWIDLVCKSFAFLPMEVAEFREWSRLMEDKQASLDLDAMIAATARIHRLTVATRNERDFKHLGVEIVNPFKS